MAGIRCMEEILKHDSDSYEITILEMNSSKLQPYYALSCFTRQNKYARYHYE